MVEKGEGYSSEAVQEQEPLLEQRDVEGQSDSVDQSQEEHYELESPSRPWWRGNLNLYLGICYFIVLWCALVRMVPQYLSLIHI